MKKSKPVKKKAAAPAKPKAAKAKPVKKPAAKAKPAVKAKAAPAKPKAAKAVAKKPVKVPAKAAAKTVKTAPKTAKIPAKKAVAPAKAAPVVKAPKAAPVKETAAAPALKSAGKAGKIKGDKAAKGAVAAPAPADAFPALDPSIKRPAKPFFLEVKPGVERVIKRGDKSAASPVLDIQARRKGPAAEESSEELAERIERELQSQSFLKRNRMRPQLCTKCGINAVAPRFTIDRELGYCDICAEILHLGETKEARRMEFNLALKKEEGEEAAAIEGPTAAEVEEEPLPEDLVD